MENDDDIFFVARHAYLRGDARPLAQFVLSQDLPPHVSDFVAKIILGEVKKLDGRKYNPITEKMLAIYGKWVWANHVIEIIGGKREPESKVIRRIADALGYDDVGSVRRALSRHKAKVRREIAMGRVTVIGHKQK